MGYLYYEMFPHEREENAQVIEDGDKLLTSTISIENPL